MIMPVTLDGAPPVVVNGVMTHAPGGGSGSGADVLKGGAGSDTLYYNGPQSQYDGGPGGVADSLVYNATPGDQILFHTSASSPPTLFVNWRNDSIANPSFESPAMPLNSYQFDPTDPNWQLSGSAGIASGNGF
jgi:hypothetical protein